MLDLKGVYFFAQVVDRGGFYVGRQHMALGAAQVDTGHGGQGAGGIAGRAAHQPDSRQFTVTRGRGGVPTNTPSLCRKARRLPRKPRGKRAGRTKRRHSRHGSRGVGAVCAAPDPADPSPGNHPKVGIIEVATERLVDVVGEGFDLAIRGHTAPLQDSNLIQRPLARAPRFLFAGADYLERAPRLERARAARSCRTSSPMGRKAAARGNCVGRKGRRRLSPSGRASRAPA
ncbi:hypothetical protein ACTMU2_26830 [Cupriavidus basilensis]